MEPVPAAMFHDFAVNIHFCTAVKYYESIFKFQKLAISQSVTFAAHFFI